MTDLDLLRQLFYARINHLGEKVSDKLFDYDEELARRIYLRLHPDVQTVISNTDSSMDQRRLSGQP